MFGVASHHCATLISLLSSSCMRFWTERDILLCYWGNSICLQLFNLSSLCNNTLEQTAKHRLLSDCSVVLSHPSLSLANAQWGHFLSPGISNRRKEWIGIEKEGKIQAEFLMTINYNHASSLNSQTGVQSVASYTSRDIRQQQMTCLMWNESSRVQSGHCESV